MKKNRYSKYKKEDTIEKLVLNKYGFGGLQNLQMAGNTLSGVGSAIENSKNTGYQYGTSSYFQDRDKSLGVSGGIANTASAVSPFVAAFKGIGEGIQNTVAAKDEYGVSDSSDAMVAVGGLFNPREQTTSAFKDISKGKFSGDTALNLAAPFLGAVRTNKKNKKERNKLMLAANTPPLVEKERMKTFGLGGAAYKTKGTNNGDILEYKGDLHSDNSGGIEQKNITVEDGENEVIGENVINSNSIKFTPSIIDMLKKEGIDITKYQGITPAEAIRKEIKRYNNRNANDFFLKNSLEREKDNRKGRYAISDASDILGSILNPSTPNYQGEEESVSNDSEMPLNDQNEVIDNPEGVLNGAAYKKGGWIQKATASIKKRGTKGVCTGSKFGSSSCPAGSKRYNLAKTFKKMAKNKKHELGGSYDIGEEYDLSMEEIKELEKQGYVLSY